MARIGNAFNVFVEVRWEVQKWNKIYWLQSCRPDCCSGRPPQFRPPRVIVRRLPDPGIIIVIDGVAVPRGARALEHWAERASEP